MHHLIGKDILRFHCVYWPAMLLAAGLEPPHQINVHGFLLVGGEKMSKTGLGQIFPADLVDDFGVDGFRYHFLRDPPSVPTATSPTRAWSPATTPTWPTTWATCCRASATVVAKKCDGIGPAPRPDSPLAAVAAEAYAETAAAWAAVAPSVALEATWRLLRETNAHLEANEPWKADPGPERRRRAGRRARGAADRGHPGHPGHSRQLRRALAPHRPGRITG